MNPVTQAEATTIHKGRFYIIASKAQTEWVHERYNFDLCDKRGRAIGAQIRHFEETRTAGGDGHNLSNWTGKAFAVKGQATRNGEPYGATQSTHYFATRDEANAWARDYLDAARKRAAKL